jgi:hypothetical protein
VPVCSMTFQIDRVAGLEVPEVCALVGLLDDVSMETVFIEVDRREVAAVDGN